MTRMTASPWTESAGNIFGEMPGEKSLYELMDNGTTESIVVEGNGTFDS